MQVVRDLDLAQDCAQEAYAAALSSWPTGGVPANPIAWLVTAARRRGIDLVRREVSLRAKLPLLVVPGEDVEHGPESGDDPNEREELSLGKGASAMEGPDAVAQPGGGDEQLRLVFLCCHPALSLEAQVALTLRLVCGVATADIAAAFLVPEATMAARITRAKKKVTVARIPLRLPTPAELPARVEGVCEVVHLLFATGHTAPSGPSLVRTDLVDRAVHLAGQLRRLLPDQAEVVGLEALLVLTDARREARTDPQGALVEMAEQDRGRWDHRQIERARQLLAGVVGDSGAGRYVLQALIALAHAEAPSAEETDWPVVLGLYDQLLVVWPSPVVALNRAVALAQVGGDEAALVEVEALRSAGRLEQYHRLHAVRGELLRRLGRIAQAAEAYQRALALVDNDVERRHLQARLVGLIRTG